MALHHRLIVGAYRVRKVAMSAGRVLGMTPADSLRVLTYHDVAPHEEAGFAAQMRWLQQSWRFVSATQFAGMISGNEPVRGRNLLLTFDDGFASQRRVAEQVLAPLGIAALFFVVSDFVSVAGRDAARQFIAENIIPGLPVAQVPTHSQNMSWSDLGALLEQGHAIGGHTRTHARLAMIQSQSVLEDEIIGGADTLALRLGSPVEHFAYTFGDLASFSPEALAIARCRFQFIHSGLRGENARDASPWAVRRDAVNPYDSLDLLGAYVEGVADFRYAKSRARYAAWL